MGTATQIRNYRVRAGKSASEVASQLGLNESWYYDLEHYDDELATTLTLFQSMELASILGVRLRDLVNTDTWTDPSISLTELPPLIEVHVAKVGISIEQFEEQVGWELRELMQSPFKAISESPIIFVQAVAHQLSINWLSLVPDEQGNRQGLPADCRTYPFPIASFLTY